MEGVAQVVQVYEFKRNSCMIDICSVFWWLEW